MLRIKSAGSAVRLNRGIITVIGIFYLCLLAAGWPLPAAAPTFDTVLYGVSYYWEYMPYERLDRDVELMRQAGVTVVRLGESSWRLMEPQEGRFDFAWLQRVIDHLHAAGIKVIVGTPTYSIPAWLFAKHPEIQVKPLNAPRALYGLRQQTDLTHPLYRFYAERVIRQLVGRFRDHPAVIGFQLDNETHPAGTADTRVQLDFRRYLKEKFTTVERLNKTWGLNYWGQSLNSFDELPPRDGILNPGYKLEWERFQQKIASDFLGWQARIVGELKRPDQFITHDFCGGIVTDIDHVEIAKALDIVAGNAYHATQEALSGEEIALSGDFFRSLKGSNYLVSETNAQTTGWSSEAQFPPFDGQLRLALFAHIASGADLVAYWHWHSLHYGQETYWKGVLAHDLEPNRVWQEMGRAAAELKRLGPQLVGLKKSSPVAILYSLDSFNGISFMPFDRNVNYMSVLNQLYHALYRLNVESDFVFPQTADFSKYKLIVVPPLYIASDELLVRLVRYVQDGGHLLVCFKSGFCDEYSTVRWSMAPGPLRQAAGFRYQEFSTLAKPLPLKGDPFGAGEKNQVSVWAELLMPETAQPLAFYDHPFFGRFPALTRNRFGRGIFTYQGTLLSDELQQKVLLDTLKTAGVDLGDSRLPVRVRHGVNRQGQRLHYLLNFSPHEQTFAYPYGGGLELLGQKPVRPGQSLTLPAWDLAIVRED